MAAKRTDSKGRVLRNGEQQRKQDGRYLYRYVDLSGQRRTVYALTLLELREKEKQIERDLQDGIDTRKGDMTLNQLFYAFMDTKDIRESTRRNYLSVWRSAVENSDIGCMKISQIKQLHVRALYSKLTKENYAASTIRMIHNLIYPVLELAVDSDIIRKNPAKGCQKSISSTKGTRTALTVEEQECFLNFVKENAHYNIYYPMLIFALSTALRVGELTGLRWADIDLKQSVVHVRQQLRYLNFGDGCKFHVMPLKTEAGRRDIPLTGVARKALTMQKELSLMLGRTAKKQEVCGIDDFVFINSQGMPNATSAINCVLDEIVRAHNRIETAQAEKERREPFLLPHISAHILRHTACTRLAESGIEPKVLQCIMGHSSISVTMDVYTHMDFSQIQEQVQNAETKIKIG